MYVFKYTYIFQRCVGEWVRVFACMYAMLCIILL